MSTIRGIDALFDEIPNSQRKSYKSRSTGSNSNLNPYPHKNDNNNNNSDYEAIDIEFQPVRTIPNSSQTKLRVERALTQSNPNHEPFYHSQTTQSITSSSQSQSQQNKSQTQLQSRNPKYKPNLGTAGVTQSQSFIQSQASPEIQRHDNSNRTSNCLKSKNKRDIRKSNINKGGDHYNENENTESDESDYDAANTSYTLNPKNSTRSAINWNKFDNKGTTFTTENLTADLDLGEFDLDNVIDEPPNMSDDRTLVKRQKQAIENDTVHKVKLSPSSNRSGKRTITGNKSCTSFHKNTKPTMKKNLDDGTHVVLAPRRYKTKRPQRIEATDDDKAKKLEILRKKKEEAERLLAEIKSLEESTSIDDLIEDELQTSSQKKEMGKNNLVDTDSSDTESNSDTRNDVDRMLDYLDKVVRKAQESQLPQSSVYPDSDSDSVTSSHEKTNADVIDFLPELPENPVDLSRSESDIEIVEKGTKIPKFDINEVQSDESDSEDDVVQPKLLAQPTVSNSMENVSNTNASNNIDNRFSEEEHQIQEYYHRLNDTDNENTPATPPPTEIDNSSSRIQDKLITQELEGLHQTAKISPRATQTSLFVHEDLSDEEDFYDAREPDEIVGTNATDRESNMLSENKEDLIIPAGRSKKSEKSLKEERLKKRAENVKNKLNDYTPYSDSSSDESSGENENDFERSTQTFVDDDIQYESDVQSLDELDKHERMLEETTRNNEMRNEGKQIISNTKQPNGTDEQTYENAKRRKRRHMIDPKAILKELEFSNPGKKVALPDVSIEGFRPKRSENVSYTESPPSTPKRTNKLSRVSEPDYNSKETTEMVRNVRARRPLPELHFDHNNPQHEKLMKNLQISNAGAKANIPEVLVIHESDSESEEERNANLQESTQVKSEPIEKETEQLPATLKANIVPKGTVSTKRKTTAPHNFNELMHLVSLKKQKQEEKLNFQKKLKNSAIEVISLSDEEEENTEKGQDKSNNEEDDEIVITNVVKTNRKNRSREERIKLAKEKKLKKIQAASQAIARFNSRHK